MAERTISKKYKNIIDTYGVTKVVSAEIGPEIFLYNDQWDTRPNWISIKDMIDLAVEKNIMPGIQLFAIQKKFWQGKDKAFYYEYLSDNPANNAKTTIGNDIYIFSNLTIPLREVIMAWDYSTIPNTLTKVKERISEQEIHLQHNDNSIHFSTTNVISNTKDISNNFKYIQDLSQTNIKIYTDISSNFNSIKEKTDISTFNSLEKKVSIIENDIIRNNSQMKEINKKIDKLTEAFTSFFNLLNKKL
jgi:hypothetical protein